MSASSSLRPLLPGLQDRYELVDEMPPVTGGRLLRARDLAFAEIVGLKQFGPGCGLPPGGTREVEATVRHLQCLAHPHLVRIYDFDASAGVLIQEWIRGVSLLDLLRRRRELSIQEVLRLLSALPATLDFLACEAVPAPRPLLGKVLFQFQDQIALDGLSTTPIDRWPPFTLKLHALSIRDLIATPSIDETTYTVIVDPRHGADISDAYGPRELARLIYELLGGRIRELDARRFSPLGALREAGNAVLRRTLLAMPHPTCEALWHDLVEAQPELRRAALAPEAGTRPVRRPWWIPEPLLGSAQPGTILSLDPVDVGAPRVRLVAQPRFQIGRSPQQADFVARLLPESETNDALTNRLSRVHAFLERSGAGIRVHDGNGKGPSLNGSFLDGEPLSPDPGTPLSNRSVLWLGREYGLDLIPLFETEAREPAIGNLGAWNGPARHPPSADDGPGGAVICLPADRQPVVRQAAWIFTEAGFALDAAAQLVWDTRGQAESPAAFHYHRGCFWLGNRSLDEWALTCGGVALGRDSIAPLVSGQSVRLGSHVFTVRLD